MKQKGININCIFLYVIIIVNHINRECIDVQNGSEIHIYNLLPSSVVLNTSVKHTKEQDQL